MTQCNLVQKSSPWIDWLKGQLTDRRIPFDIFSFADSSAIDTASLGCPIVEIAGTSIPKFDDLTVNEQIIFEAIEQNSSTAAFKIQVFLRDLGQLMLPYLDDICDEIAAKLDLEGAEIAADVKAKDKGERAKILAEKRQSLVTIQDCKAIQLSQYIFPGSSIEYQLMSETGAYQTYDASIIEKKSELIALSNNLQNKAMTNLGKVVFFMASRVGSEWLNPAKAQFLSNRKAQAILDFITLEANGGVEPLDDLPVDEEAKQGKE